MSQYLQNQKDRKVKTSTKKFDRRKTYMIDNSGVQIEFVFDEDPGPKPRIRSKRTHEKQVLNYVGDKQIVNKPASSPVVRNIFGVSGR